MKKLSVLAAMFLFAVFMGGATGGGCESDLGSSGQAQIEEMKQTESNQQRLMKSQPPPQLESSLERKQLIERLIRFNTEDKVSYIYLLSLGRPIAFFPIKGKVSSVNSMLTTTDQVIHTYASGGTTASVVASPNLDGSYGSNGDAIFFFQTDGTYMEWNGEYLLCDRPLSLTVPPLIVDEKK